MKSEPRDEGEAVEYLRVLDEGELIAMSVHLDTRIKVLGAELARRGQSLPIDQIANHYVVGLLENICGPEQSMRVREWHCMWLDRILDKAEAAERLGALGIFEGASE